MRLQKQAISLLELILLQQFQTILENELSLLLCFLGNSFEGQNLQPD